MSSKEILVFITLGTETFLVGKLYCYNNKGRESASFEYDKVWLNNPERFALEPVLTLTNGQQHTEKALFGSIGDSAPDRWGRILMQRANKTNKTLFELDYLLGVNDFIRQGALRFSTDGINFLAENKNNSIPPLVKLPDLLYASEKFLEKNETSEDLKLLLAPGSSLGGARPKASIIDKDGSLAIAKFPRKDDDFDMVSWEAVALKLAQIAKITTTYFRLEKILNKSVLIVKRFDRINNNRIPFISAMSMLNASDNDKIQYSYIDIAYSIMEYGINPEKDLEELWRRMVFNILINNTDDHLRNHGFLYQRGGGWTLSPAYDLNPNLDKSVFATSIDDTGANNTVENAIRVAKEFRLSNDKVNEILKEIKEALADWRKIAKAFDINKGEISKMERIFDGC